MTGVYHVSIWSWETKLLSNPNPKSHPRVVILTKSQPLDTSLPTPFLMITLAWLVWLCNAVPILDGLIERMQFAVPINSQR